MPVIRVSKCRQEMDLRDVVVRLEAPALHGVLCRSFVLRQGIRNCDVRWHERRGIFFRTIASIGFVAGLPYAFCRTHYTVSGVPFRAFHRPSGRFRGRLPLPLFLSTNLPPLPPWSGAVGVSSGVKPRSLRF